MIFTDALEALRTSFLESLRVRGQSPATLRARSQSLTTFFLWLVSAGIDDVRELTREHVRTYALWLRQQRFTTGTLHAKLISLRRFFEHLEAIDAVLINPCLGLLLPKREERLPRAVLSQAEARRILDAPNTQTRKGIRDRAILELFYSTGIRGEEMAALTIHEVDCKNGFVRVTHGKFAKDRVVPMGATAAQYVREYLAHVRLPWSAQCKDERALWLSAIEPHRALKKQAIAAMVNAYKNLAGIERPGRTHLWRHTCATHLVANGANLLSVQRLLGHRSLKTTQLYTRVSAVELRSTMHRHPRSRTPRRSAAKVGARA